MVPNPSAPSALSVLNAVFGYESFRGQQSAVIDHILSGGDALVLMPTGAGKSLCFQIPALVNMQTNRGVTVVISPLIALMHDQVTSLQELGVSAAYLNSSQDASASNQVEKQLRDGQITLLYAAPERVMTGRFLALLEQLYLRGQLALFAIDEAHCVSQWGHDFRPEYGVLRGLHERFPLVPRIALTATADETTRQDIVQALSLQAARQFISSFDRPNIRYAIHEKTDPRKQLLRFIQTHHVGESGIVYCLSRKKVEETADFLNGQGIASLPYHAGLDQTLRQNHQNTFLRSEAGMVMVATIAFGMGIDKPDVRFVAHLDLPKNIESYYQETGRAGRDASPANAWLCYGFQDVMNQRRMIDSSPASAEYKAVMRTKLDALLGLSETIGCRRAHLLNYFNDALFLKEDRSTYRCNNCDNCENPPASWDASEAAKKLVSCVYRVLQATPQYGFAAGHIVDILRGVLSEKVLQFGHEALSTFGIGKDISELAWKSVVRQLINLDVLTIDFEAYQALRLTQGSRDFLRSPNPVLMRAIDSRNGTNPARQDRLSVAKTMEQGLSPHAKNALAALKAWRSDQAKSLSLPAYVVFHDVTLHAIAIAEPRSLAELSKVSGLGEKKLASYGVLILEVLAHLSN